MSKSDTPKDSSRRAFIKTGITATLALPLTLNGCSSSLTEPIGDVSTDVSDTGQDVVENSIVDPDSWDKANEVAWSPDASTEDELRFPLGVASGAVTATSVLFWGFAEDEAPQTLKIWRAHPDPEKVYLVHDKTVADADGYLKAHVDGLAPATTYHYAWFHDESSSRSPIGTVKTAFPDDWLAPMTIAATACTTQRTGHGAQQ